MNTYSRFGVIFIVLLCFLPIETGAKSKAVNKSQITSLFEDFQGYDGFDVVKIGNVGTSLIKSVIRVSAASDGDSDLKNALKVISGVKKVTVVDYGECSLSVRKDFRDRLSAIMADVELLAEAKDHGDNIKLYGVTDEDAGTVKNFIMLDDGDYTVICLFGTISLDTVLKIAAE